MARRDGDDFLDFAAAMGPRMRRTAFLLCGDWDRAGDIVQESLIRLYVAWPRLEPGPGMSSYARRTVVHVHADWARKRSSQEVVTDVLPQQQVDDATAGIPERVVLMNALAALPERQRACVVLRYYEDLGVAEVATLLGCREGTVKSQTARGIGALRRAYQRAGGDLGVDDRGPREEPAW
ncbi:SigE family RNA polymerase sigma factor [Phycicoccus sonneratiae]|uniref:SigE family RNA polymerase sigma factor n=1 Tax=Phycicoccus sonneratiae TaxID=2807628 RepID=A0ABS2CQG1_9MICO|nr:SigE family RNA polymerase sigma factor [Phycicoccus sonneraticus]MBM6402123.1 SigE family RNA polymerase sigma factor [Phycicoccus sonneraticus]